MKQIQVLDALDEDNFEIGEDEKDASWGGVVAPMDDLEVPSIVDNDEGHGRDDINEGEDQVEEDDDYRAFNIRIFLDSLFVLKIYVY